MHYYNTYVHTRGERARAHSHDVSISEPPRRRRATLWKWRNEIERSAVLCARHVRPLQRAARKAGYRPYSWKIAARRTRPPLYILPAARPSRTPSRAYVRAVYITWEGRNEREGEFRGE